MKADSLITACKELLSGLSPEDRADVRKYLPYLLDDDPEEREAAEVAIREIVTGGPMFAIPLEVLWK